LDSPRIASFVAASAASPRIASFAAVSPDSSRLRRLM
jgi:hypothetical protein